MAYTEVGDGKENLCNLPHNCLNQETSLFAIFYLCMCVAHAQVGLKCMGVEESEAHTQKRVGTMKV